MAWRHTMVPREVDHSGQIMTTSHDQKTPNLAKERKSPEKKSGKSRWVKYFTLGQIIGAIELLYINMYIYIYPYYI